MLAIYANNKLDVIKMSNDDLDKIIKFTDPQDWNIVRKRIINFNITVYIDINPCFYFLSDPSYERIIVPMYATSKSELKIFRIKWYERFLENKKNGVKVYYTKEKGLYIIKDSNYISKVWKHFRI